MKRKLFFTLLASILYIFMMISIARCYEYDSEFDPIQIFSYDVLEMKQISPNLAIACLEHEFSQPRFIVACLMSSRKGVMIIAYAYLNDKRELKHFLFDRIDAYKETPPDADTAKMLLEKLQKLHQMVNAEKEKEKNGV